MQKGKKEKQACYKMQQHEKKVINFAEYLNTVHKENQILNIVKTMQAINQT